MSEVFFLNWIECNFGWTNLSLIFLYYLKPCLQNQLLTKQYWDSMPWRPFFFTAHWCKYRITTSRQLFFFFLHHFLFSFSEMIVRFLEAFILASSSLICIQVYQFIFFLFFVIYTSCSTGVSDNKVKMFTSPERQKNQSDLNIYV